MLDTVHTCINVQVVVYLEVVYSVYAHQLFSRQDFTSVMLGVPIKAEDIEQNRTDGN